MLLKLSMLVTIMSGSRSIPSCCQWNVRGMSPSLASQVKRVLDPVKAHYESGMDGCGEELLLCLAG